MANCNNLFEHFNSTIRLTDEKRTLLRTVRNELRKRMQERSTGYYQLVESAGQRKVIEQHRLEHKSQGSYVMDTIITPKDDDFDLDDGAYFIGSLSKEARPEAKLFHKWVAYAVGEDEKYGVVKDKDTCVRVEYKQEKFHIDLPIYYTEHYECPELAHKNEKWPQSNPIEFIEWFENKIDSGFQKGFIYEEQLYSKYQQWQEDIRKNDVQLRRLVRYLKAWGDHLRGEMPPGIVMTILAAENYKAHERDDMALRDTLQEIKAYLERNGFKCPRPTTPIDEDLFADYGEERKKYFKNELNKFIDSANQAISSRNQREACLKWQKHLGSRFSCALAKDEFEGAEATASPAVIRTDDGRSA